MRRFCKQRDFSDSKHVYVMLPLYVVLVEEYYNNFEFSSIDNW
jgi:hypothetical protein